MKVIEFEERLRKGQTSITLPREIKQEQAVKVVIFSTTKCSEGTWDYWDDCELENMGKTSGLKWSSHNS